MTGTGIIEVISLLNKICESVEKVLPLEDSIVLSKTRNILFDRLNIRHNNDRPALKQLKSEVAVHQNVAKVEEPIQTENSEVLLIRNETAVLQKELQALRESSNASIQEAEAMVLVLQQVVAELEKQVGEPSPDQLQNPDYCATFNENSKSMLASMLLECSRSLDEEQSVADSLRGKLTEQNTLQNLAKDCQVKEAAAHQAALDVQQHQEELEVAVDVHKRVQLQLQEALKAKESDQASTQQVVIEARDQCEGLKESITAHHQMLSYLHEALIAKGDDQASANKSACDARKWCDELKESYSEQQRMVLQLQELLKLKTREGDQEFAQQTACNARKRCKELEVQVTEYKQMEFRLQQALEAKDDLVSGQKLAAESARKKCEELEAFVAEQQCMNSQLKEELKIKSSSNQISTTQQADTDTIKQSVEPKASVAEQQELESQLQQARKAAEEDSHMLSAERQTAADLRKRCGELEVSITKHERMESQLQQRLKVEEEDKVAAQNTAVAVVTQKCEELDTLVVARDKMELKLNRKLKSRDEEECSRIKQAVDSNTEQLNSIIDKLKGDLSNAERRLRISEAENLALVNGSIARAVGIQPTDLGPEYTDHTGRYSMRDGESGETDVERDSPLSPDTLMSGAFEVYESNLTSTNPPDDGKLDVRISKPDISIQSNRVGSTLEDDASTEQPTIPVSHDLYLGKRDNSSEELLGKAPIHMTTSSLWSPMPSAGINRRLEDDTLLVLETGDWQVRMGLIDIKCGHSYYDEFACCLARPRRNAGEASDLVSMASGVSAKMYSSFRSEGVFVGADAWFCCMDHPDAGLRAKLELSSPLERGHIVEDRMDDLQRLWAAAFKKSKVDSSLTPTIVTFKPNATEEEVRSMAYIMLDRFKVPAVRMVNEASVIALAGGITTGIVVSLGHTSTFVCPMFEGCVISDAVRTENVGGKDIDRFLDYMLLSRTNEDYNQMVERRRLDYSRVIKEQHCYVAKNFAVEAGTAGHFQRKSMKVFEGAVEADEKLSKYGSMTTSEYYDQQNEDDPVEVSFTQKNGKELLLKVGRERFHAPEILFNPSIWEDSENSVSLSALIVDSVMACHADIRLPLVQNVVLAGNTSKILGLEQRLQMELELELSEQLCDEPIVRTIDDRNLNPTSPMSRATPSAVLKGSELLFSKESDCHDSWILQSDYESNPSVIQRQYYFCSD